MIRVNRSKKVIMKQPSQPLAEVFGYLVNDCTDKAERYRNQGAKNVFAMD